MPSDISFIETLPAFVERVSKLPTPKALVNELAWQDTISMAHGQPRDGKTLAELEIALAASTGTNAFGMDRFFVPKAIPVCYLSLFGCELRGCSALASVHPPPKDA